MEKIKETLEQLKDLYEAVSTENEEEIGKQFHLLETLFLGVSKEEGYDPDYREPMIVAFEEKNKQRLQELKEKMNKEESLSSLTEKTRIIETTIKEFWRTDYFQYIENISCQESGVIVVELGFSLRMSTLFERHADNQKELWEQKKKDWIKEGFILNEDQTELVHCDTNIEKVTEVITNRFPSAKVFQLKGRRGRNGEHYLNRMTVRIREINDI